MWNSENTPSLFSYFFICFLITVCLVSTDFISISGKTSFLATDRVAVGKGIRLLRTVASNEM